MRAPFFDRPGIFGVLSDYFASWQIGWRHGVDVVHDVAACACPREPRISGINLRHSYDSRLWNGMTFWRAWGDSNSRPTDSKSAALSI